jgi:ABC-type glycerol-3-phosphate transport system substrate-binding protein
LYVDANGNWNDGSSKSVGQDGVAGTFDDGLPVTVSDFFALMDQMVSVGVTPLTMYGSGAYYFSSFLTNLFADYEGYNDFMLNYVLEGTDSDLGDIELEDAYKLKNGQKGKEFALEFAKRFMSNNKYYTSTSFQTSQDNYAAQTEFLISTETKNPIAMLVDGPWWEREASMTMKDMVDAYKDNSYAYGTREFGVMPMPEADDGSSAEGNTIACTSGRSILFMNNLSKNKDAAGEFLKFCMSEEGLRIATAYSGVMRPYEYTMTDEYLSKMTPFGKSVYNYNKGTQVVFEEVPVSEFLRNEGSSYCSYLSTWVSSEDTTANIAQYFLKADSTVEKYLNGMAIDKAVWQTKVEEYRFRVGE